MNITEAVKLMVKMKNKGFKIKMTRPCYIENPDKYYIYLNRGRYVRSNNIHITAMKDFFTAKDWLIYNEELDNDDYLKKVLNIKNETFKLINDLECEDFVLSAVKSIMERSFYKFEKTIKEQGNKC